MTLISLTVMSFATPSSALAGPLLSGYGGPGAGNQAILGLRAPGWRRLVGRFLGFDRLLAGRRGRNGRRAVWAEPEQRLYYRLERAQVYIRRSAKRRCRGGRRKLSR